MTLNLTEIQHKLNKVSCPECHYATIDVTLRCDLGYGECLAVATCITCGTLYEVSTERCVLEKGQKDYPTSVCPGFSRSRCELDMRCELPSRQCFYVAHCTTCDHPFVSGKP